ncbi:MAG: hypothetical protein A2860_03640 [Candidatus Levybacteria bacterium RIFCSPHIGHO2_01_FULL_37_33]|nr:MAG: hypothetical protein A2860_03640 [Candidatus Levybacteria bacterium RIFCSPHIGHO2_01_FULL_37_33]OGH15716.1 MAG: hypothetical protein A3C97_01950 [Candidatus Levybacteria bacterium RIFCSPHIGHO2_02_FULL_37_11]OGH29269.1 MAG: hypothetical protein A3F30_03000 [Candidatus Levybacteria bacterium RIFCSPHIGHO2_12_FULL_37_12]OGH33028.1 MAG: hypothetical protein A2953_03665 [Candidatus Levybacteria bacterium RIFCSPLOWO2_01_FULL_36_54]
MSKIKLLGTFYVLTIIFLFLYSFTQVDLNLTLSQFSLWQITQKFFQQIGYFNRPLSTSFYILIVLLFFLFYFSFLYLASKNKIEKNQIWFLTIISTIILSFSYNAFSYDLFNYIFDAKIITHYGQNPYLHKALDFPTDPMLNFMRWTHRTYPYGPSWLILTVPLSFIGFNFFLPTFFLFKFLSSLSFLGTAYFISKILKKISPKNELYGLTLFVFNPLIIIEVLVSSHNDLPMIFFAVLSLHLLINKKYFTSVLSLLFSIGIKFATFFLLPIFLYPLFTKNKNQINWAKLLNYIIPLMTISLILVITRTNFQPWYLLYIVSFAPLIQNRYQAFIISTVFPFFALLEYVPFLYKGDWNQPVPNILFWLTIIGVASSIALILGKPLFVKLFASNNK